ncbi:hypothetical protein E0H73_00880 [Kribbella pittospori]|uniref:Uncharacterized protein n=1 Tax=Kribbella pittospori TaxID=722689 RepID=A0A4R0KXZ0_9ACTN|nr:hypothetical protein E0H73_00880 [Kribbella pittospori]
MVSIRGPVRSLAHDDARTAVSELYSRHWAGLVRLAVLVVSDRPAAEDAVQEAFTDLYRHWPLRDNEGAGVAADHCGEPLPLGTAPSPDSAALHPAASGTTRLRREHRRTR